jgi:hypothetical protein
MLRSGIPLERPVEDRKNDGDDQQFREEITEMSQG